MVIDLAEPGAGFSNSGENRIRPNRDFPYVPGENTPVAGYKGYLVVGNRLKPLPLGSTLDAGRGFFYWIPAPGFTGEYRLVFLGRDREGAIIKRFTWIRVCPKY